MRRRKTTHSQTYNQQNGAYTTGDLEDSRKIYDEIMAASENTDGDIEGTEYARSGNNAPKSLETILGKVFGATK